MLSVPLFRTVDPGALVDHTGFVRDPRDDFSSGGFPVIHYEENAVLSSEISAHGAGKMLPSPRTYDINIKWESEENGGRTETRSVLLASGAGISQMRKGLDDPLLIPGIRQYIDSDGRLVMTAKIREIFSRKPEEFDPRKYLGPARETLREMYCRKNRDVLGSAGRAPEILTALKGIQYNQEVKNE